MIHCRSVQKKGAGNLGIFFLCSLVLLISGCAATSALQSRTLEKPAAPVRSMVLIYAEADFVDKRVRDPVPREQTTFGKVGYYDIPKLLAERAPLVFSVNGLSASKILTTDTASLSGFLEKAAKDFPDLPILVVQLVGGTVSYGTSTNLHFRQQVNLYRSQPSLGKLWTGDFSISVGYSSLMTIGFDQENVDRMLVTILRQLATDGIIVEPTGGIKQPKSVKAG
jgi:hypothetical protein